MTQKKYAIVNEFDKPYPRLVTQVIDGKHYYMMRKLEKQLKQYDGMQPKAPTFLEDFGFQIKEMESEVYFKKIKESKAVYSAYRNNIGEIREWQGEIEFYLPKVTLK